MVDYNSSYTGVEVDAAVGNVQLLVGGGLSGVNIDGGSIDGASVGAIAASTGRFSSLSSLGTSTLSGSATIGGATISGIATRTLTIQDATSSAIAFLHGATATGAIYSDGTSFDVWAYNSSLRLGGGVGGVPAIGLTLFATTGAALFAGNVVATGGIDNTVIGGTTPAAGTFTSLTATGEIITTGAVTAASAGEGHLGGEATAGAFILGNGATYDVVLANKIGTQALRIPTGTADVEVIGRLTTANGISLPNTATIVWDDAGGTPRQIFQYFSDNYLYIDAPNGGHVFRNGAGNTEKFRIELDGVATFTNSVDIPAGSFYSIGGGSNVYLQESAGTLFIGTGNAPRVTITSTGTTTFTGNVGVGAAPSSANPLYATSTVDAPRYVGINIGSTAITATNKAGFAVYEVGTIVASLDYARDGSSDTNLFAFGNQVFKNNSGETGRIDTAGKLTVPGGVRSGASTIASVASGTPVNILTVTTGLYIVMAYLDNSGDVANYTASAHVMCDSGGARITADNGGLMTLTLSGLNVQATQSAGIAQTISYQWLRV